MYNEQSSTLNGTQQLEANIAYEMGYSLYPYSFFGVEGGKQ